MQSTSSNTVPLSVPLNASQGEFEALIDLLATDEPVQLELGESLQKSEVAHDLRDEGGRLDFSKIKTLFSSNGMTPQDPIAISTRNDQGSVEEADLTQAEGSPLRTSGISTLVLSKSPINIVDSLSVESGLPPVVAEATPPATAPPLQGDNRDLDLIDLSSDHPPWASESNAKAKVSLSGIPGSFHGSPPLVGSVATSGLEPAYSLRQQSEEHPIASLALARQEVAMLRMRVGELEDLIRESRDRFPPQQEHRREHEDGETFMLSKAPSVGKNNREELHAERMQRDAGELKTQTHTHMTNAVDQAQDLNTLSLAQTRLALKSLLNDLGLPSSYIHSLLIEGRKARTIPTSSLDEIHRAVDLVAFLDELVWRRSRMGAVYDNAYSEENVRALRDRFELWERIVRTRR